MKLWPHDAHIILWKANAVMTTFNIDAINDSQALAGLLTGRYGVLALTRAAGAAAAAERKGDRERSNLWKSVIANLRHEMASETGGR
jgi:hypothetical protein